MQQRRHDTDPGQYESQARIERLRDEIAAIEHRLAELDRAEREQHSWDEPPGPGRREPDAHIQELNRHREELAERARQREMELEELHRHVEDRQRDIENELHGIHEEIEELMRHRNELAERAHQRERESQELRENTERRQQEIQMELRDIHEQMKGIEEELARIERERQEHRRRVLDEVRGQTAELREHLGALHERAEHLQRALDELGDEDAETEQLRRALAETREQIRLIERQLDQRPGPPARPPRRRPMSPPPEPEAQCRELMEQLERIKLELRETQEAEGEAVESLRVEVEELREVAEETNEQLGRLLLQDHPSTVGMAGHCSYWR
jgi:chromosome segregation ATPase